MDEFLVDGPKGVYECASVDELKLQFGTLRASKVAETKAEHITATFEFRPTAVFHVPENESDPADATQNGDAVNGDGHTATEPAANGTANGAANGTATTTTTTTTTTRDIRAHETLMDQTADDPVLQKLVAKHIVTSVGVVDGSLWAGRSISRAASGWSFQYICKGSMQAWLRQNAKQSAKVLVGESSGKDGQDPVILGKRVWVLFWRPVIADDWQPALRSTVADLSPLRLLRAIERSPSKSSTPLSINPSPNWPNCLNLHRRRHGRR